MLAQIYFLGKKDFKSRENKQELTTGTMIKSSTQKSRSKEDSPTELK